MIDEFSYCTIVKHYSSFNRAIYSCKHYIEHPCKQLFILRFFFLQYVLKSTDMYYHFTPSDTKYCVANLVKAGLLVKIELNRVNYKLTSKGLEAVRLFERTYKDKFYSLQFKAKPTQLI